jgi:hypothetical protein
MKRVACWSPEHFALSSERADGFAPPELWQLYATETRAYLDRLLDFTGKTGSGRDRIDAFFQTRLTDAVLRRMFEELRHLASMQPAAIGKYHDLRYLTDTIARTVHRLFSRKPANQQFAYDFFVALALVQSLPERLPYLESPDLYFSRLTSILELCAGIEGDLDNGPEEEILQLLREHLK